MNKKKELAKNTIIIALGKVCTQLITFILLPLYTHYLNTNDYGTSDLFITYINLFAPLLSLQLEYAVFRFLIDARKKEEEINKIINSSLIILTITSFITMIFIIGIDIVNHFNYMIFMLFIVVITMFCNMFLQIARGIGNNKVYSMASFLFGTTNVILNVIFIVVLKFGINGIFCSLLLANIICFIYIMFSLKLYKCINYRFIDKKIIKRLLMYSAPMIPNSICWWIISVSDKTILNFILGSTSVGIYAVATKFPSIIISIYNIFNMSWTESISIHIDDKDADVFLSDIFNEIILIFSGVCSGLIAFMPIIFRVLVGKDYYASYKYIPFLILGAFFNIIMGLLSGIYIGRKKSKEMAISTFISAILNILINIIFIKFIGIWSVVISTILSYICVSIYRYYDVKKYNNIKIKFKSILNTIVVFVVSIMLYYVKNNIILVLNMILTTILVLVMNKKIIKGIYNEIKNLIIKKMNNTY